MDGYLYHRDSYRAGLASTPASAGYYSSYAPSRYQPSYAVDRRSSYALPAPDSLSSYARVPVDPYAGYSTSVAYHPELLPPPRYAASARAAAPTFRPRQRLGQKKKPPPAQNLGPKKKAFKQTQKVNLSVEKVTTPKKALQKKSLQGEKKEAKSEIKAGKPQKSQAESLAKETQELHSLYRTGVDPTTGKKFDGISVKKADATSGKKNNSSVAGKKRKAEPQKESTTEAPAIEKKKFKRKKNKKLAKGKKLPAKKDQKPAASTPEVVKTEAPPLSEEEKKEVEASLELQRGMCKSVGEFLGVPCAGREPENKEAADADGSEGKPAEAIKPEEAQKSEEAPKIETLTPEEEKEYEERGFQFFSKILEENQDLRKLYVDKCNAGTFECLVCHTVDAETSKKFGNLMSLVMHASMRKQKRPEHRGYGRALCSVLGWDPLKTPRPPRVNKDTPASDGSTKEEKEGGKPASQSETGEKATEASDIEAAKASEEGITEDPAKDSVAE